MHHTFGSYCAHVVEVSVAPGSNGQKRVTIHKVVSVGDVGQPVNLSMLEAQMQGGIIDGLGAAFYGEVPIEKGRATSRNFGDYRMIRMREAPLAIEAHFIPSRLRPTGFGEPPLPPIAPAVANAIAALTGERIRMMPFIKAGYVLVDVLARSDEHCSRRSPETAVTVICRFAVMRRSRLVGIDRDSSLPICSDG